MTAHLSLLLRAAAFAERRHRGQLRKDAAGSPYIGHPIELARILFSDAETLLLDEPTNHLDADSITWLKSFLSAHKGGLVVISHDVELLDAVVNKVWHLDANRAVVDVYNLGWKPYLAQRETDQRRRRQERANTERKIEALSAQADKMRAKATKARAAQSVQRLDHAVVRGAPSRTPLRQPPQVDDVTDQVQAPAAQRGQKFRELRGVAMPRAQVHVGQEDRAPHRVRRGGRGGHAATAPRR